MKEANDEAYFNRRVKESGGEVRKANWIGRRGAPDRLAGWPNGRHAYVELKHPDQDWGLQDYQARQIARMRSWGMEVYVIEGRPAIDAFIETMTR